MERLHKTREEIDVATAGRCVALGLAKDISRASSHLELHRLRVYRGFGGWLVGGWLVVGWWLVKSV